MEWYESAKPYIAVAFLGPALAMSFILMGNKEPLELMFPAIVLFVCFPIIMMGLFFWITGRGKWAINMVDWSKYSEEECRMIVSHTGFWIMMTVIVLLYGLSLLFISLWVGVTIAVIAAVIMFATLFRPYFRRIERPLPTMDSVKAFSVFLIVIAVSLVPTTFFLSTGSSQESVDITLGEESFTVKAPMFDHTFRYDEIDDIQYYDDFDKGTRKMGYNDYHVSSGKFHNDMFGDYHLAAYTSVKPCIAISVNGDMYAFNQDSDAATLGLFDTLKSKMPVS